MESPCSEPSCGTNSQRAARGRPYSTNAGGLVASCRDFHGDPDTENNVIGLHIVSEISEPTTLLLLALGGLAVVRRRV